VVGIGALASVGLHSRTVAAAVRAGISRLEERRGPEGRPVAMGLLSTFDLRTPALERAREMLASTAREALAPLWQARDWPRGTPLTLLLSTPSAANKAPHPPAAPPLVDLAAQLSIAVDDRVSQSFACRHTGGLAATARALELLQQGVSEICLVGAADSHRDMQTLAWLEDQGRLKSLERPCGLMPGEGAAALLLCTERTRRGLGLSSLGVITAVSCQDEPFPWYAGTATMGRGLTEAIGLALEAGLPQAVRADTTWCDLNGEPWRADEWMYAYLRTGKRHASPLRLRHPADCLGDVGAATGAMLLVLAALDLAHRRTNARSALVFAASDTTPQRAAAVLVSPQEGLT
jgi:3-oxoacyl-[acyl-carrier-protein] synthase-1